MRTIERVTVTELTREIKTLLEGQFYQIELIGEISSYMKHSSGHIYFSLKDKNSYIKAVIWSSSVKRIRDEFKIGDNVILRGKLSLYEKRGEYQIVVSSMRKEGVGDLHRQFEKLKQKLEKEGLFDAPKKELPRFPKRVALLTAKTGAALTDFLNIAQKRNPNLNVIIIPTIVQGRDAAKNIAYNIELVNRSEVVDLIVLTRGGGSIEDLWPFNEEIVARAIFNSKKPILSAVGHERDFTISDFVADKRAATPSEAAEIVFFEVSEVKDRLNMINSKINHIFNNILLNKENKLYRFKKDIERALPHKIKDQQFILQNLSNRLSNSINFKTTESWNQLNYYKSKISENQPKRKLSEHKNQINIKKIELNNNINKILKEYKEKLYIYKTKLEILSPNKVLEKGYSLIVDENNIPVTSSKKLKSGDNITIRFNDGKNKATID